MERLRTLRATVKNSGDRRYLVWRLTDIEVWKTFLQRQDAKAYLFPSETGVTPLRPNNHWKREIRPRLEKFGLEWVNFQVLRRTNASLSRKAKVDDKVSADQRGHGLGVSLGVYSISDLEQKVEAVTKLESEVIERKKGGLFGAELLEKSNPERVQ